MIGGGGIFLTAITLGFVVYDVTRPERRCIATQDFVANEDITLAPRISPSRERILAAIAEDPARPNKAIARDLGVSPARLAAALGAAKQSLAGK